MKRCQVRLAPSGRWILVNADNPQFAWSGSEWLPHLDGVGSGPSSICTFATLEELSAYVREHDLDLDYGS